MIHDSHSAEAKKTLKITGILLALFVVTVNIKWPHISFISTNYALIHTALEIIIIVIGSLTFSIVWGIRQEKPSPSLVLLASVFLCVAILDLAHIFSDTGMPNFVTYSSREKSIYFWQMAHLFGSLALLIVAINPVRTYNSKFTFGRVLPICLLITAAIFWLYFAILADIANLYLIDKHVTNIKLYVEYFLILLNFIAAGLYLKRIFEPRQFNTSALFAACFILGLGEYFYTLYGSSVDIYNLLGHVYKIIGFGFLYWAVFVETLRNPYKQLRESRQQLRATLQAMPDLVFEVDENYRFVANYSANTDGLNIRDDLFIGHPVDDVMPPNVADVYLQALEDASANGISKNNIVCLSVNNERRWFDMTVSGKPMTDSQGDHFVIVSRDITERLTSEKSLRMLAQAFSQSPIAFFITDVNHVIKLCNQAYADICNSTIVDLIGQQPYRVNNVKAYKSTTENIINQIENGRSWHGELQHIGNDGQTIFLQTFIFPVKNDDGQISNYITYLNNITEQKQANARIRQLSRYDQLTGLPNLNLLNKYFDLLLSQKTQMAVMWVDLDNFKDINDSLGYPIGDELLRIVATRLQDIFSGDHMISRLSGDDFILIKSIHNPSDAGMVANEIQETFTQAINLSDQDIYITASIGVVLYPDDGDSLDDLLKKAESAKYKSKNIGRNNICFYTQDLQSNATRFLELRNALKSAHLYDELRMVFQPQFNMVTQALVGVEALIRWCSPKLGEIKPAEFMRLAEASGIIVKLSDWILRSTLEHMRNWLDQGIDGIRVAINLSPVQFNSPDLAKNIIGMLAQYNLNPASLSLEITEAMAMANPKLAAEKIHELQALNINFAIDDFGTGYSSLSYLKRFKIQKLKIDKSFIRELDRSADDQAIVDAIIKMSHKLGILTIAEGVETFDQLARLKELGCDEVQGFYFSAPLESSDFVRFAKKCRLN